jgi:uncharacterized membrane protein HdeD (DUF308 family)
MTDSSPDTAGLFVRRWWTVLLRGLTAVAFGFLAFVWPHRTIATLVLPFGVYALIHGIVSLITAIGSRQQTRSRWLSALEGVAGIWAGIETPRAPSTTPVVLIFFVGCGQ